MIINFSDLTSPLKHSRTFEVKSFVRLKSEEKNRIVKKKNSIIAEVTEKIPLEFKRKDLLMNSVAFRSRASSSKDYELIESRKMTANKEENENINSFRKRVLSMAAQNKKVSNEKKKLTKMETKFSVAAENVKNIQKMYKMATKYKEKEGKNQGQAEFEDNEETIVFLKDFDEKSKKTLIPKKVTRDYIKTIYSIDKSSGDDRVLNKKCHFASNFMRERSIDTEYSRNGTFRPIRPQFLITERSLEKTSDSKKIKISRRNKSMPKLAWPHLKLNKSSRVDFSNTLDSDRNLSKKKFLKDPYRQRKIPYHIFNKNVRKMMFKKRRIRVGKSKERSKKCKTARVYTGTKLF